MHLNTSTETSEFCCDSIAHWWAQHGSTHYPGAKGLLVLCDGAAPTRRIAMCFKDALQNLADRLGLEIRIAHYLPYCSKQNPIEHRLFALVTRVCQGVTFHTLYIARQFMSKAKTSTGLKVTAEVLGGVYVKGKKVAADFLVNMRSVFDEHLPRWNYRAVPANG